MSYRAGMARTRGAFAEMLKDGRRRRGWSQDQLADEIGVSRRTIVRWEKGDITNPAPEQLNAVSDALGVPREMAYRAVGWLPKPDDEPTPERAKGSESRRFDDVAEQEIWDIGDRLSWPESERWELIDFYRARKAGRAREAN